MTLAEKDRILTLLGSKSRSCQNVEARDERNNDCAHQVSILADGPCRTYDAARRVILAKESR